MFFFVLFMSFYEAEVNKNEKPLPGIFRKRFSIFLISLFPQSHGD